MEFWIIDCSNKTMSWVNSIYGFEVILLEENGNEQRFPVELNGIDESMVVPGTTKRTF